MTVFLLTVDQNVSRDWNPATVMQAAVDLSIEEQS